MKVLYLFSGVRGPLIEEVHRGTEHDGGLWGMLRLRHFGMETYLVELEQYLPGGISRFLRRRVLGVYGSHLPLLWKFFRYDMVFTAGAFSTQLVFTILRRVFRVRTPLWIMYDFSIIGLLGQEKTGRQRVFKYLVEHSDGIVTLGAEEAKMLQKRFPHLRDRIACIPYGVDSKFFKPLAVPQERLVLAVGIDPERDWPTFFKACEGIDARVMVTGSRRRTREFHPPPFVETGFFDRPKLNELYSKAAVVVIPLDTSSGANDAMGVSTVYEGLAMGKALVVSRTPTMETYITDGENGLLVPQHDPVAMYNAIKKLLENSSLRARLGEAARAYALRELDPERCTEKLANYFRRIQDLGPNKN